MPRLYCLLIAAALAASGLAQAKTLNFSGYAWKSATRSKAAPAPMTGTRTTPGWTPRAGST